MESNRQRPRWLDLLILILTPLAGMALGVAITQALGVGQADYGNLIVNACFLAACLVLIPVFGFTRQDLGLKVFTEQIRPHLLLSFLVLCLYLLFYVFAIRISSLRPFSAAVAWGLLTYLVVVFAEELYFRGMLYGYLEQAYTPRAALIVSALLFGLFHARSGPGNILSKSLTGFLWGSIRYATRMIFLIIFPIHYTFNATWLLFEGSWNNPPLWAIYALPLLEVLLGLAIVFLHDRRSAASAAA